MSAFSQLFRTKSLDQLMAHTQEEGHQLKKVLGPWNLVALGIEQLHELRAVFVRRRRQGARRSRVS